MENYLITCSTSNNSFIFAYVATTYVYIIGLNDTNNYSIRYINNTTNYVINLNFEEYRQIYNIHRYHYLELYKLVYNHNFFIINNLYTFLHTLFNISLDKNIKFKYIYEKCDYLIE